MHVKRLLGLAICLILFVLLVPASAQDVEPTALPVTADEVNAVARQMYCPVCENIPLDVCSTAACAQWRDEIRIQLSQGQSPEQVIENFVGRYGDRVVGTPQDPSLRALSLWTPWLLAGLVVIVVVIVFIGWSRSSRKAAAEIPAGEAAVLSDDDYRARLERDLAARR
jgi:cytochrome c-type biogenesis protein CcmH